MLLEPFLRKQTGHNGHDFGGEFHNERCGSAIPAAAAHRNLWIESISAGTAGPATTKAGTAGPGTTRKP